MKWIDTELKEYTFVLTIITVNGVPHVVLNLPNSVCYSWIVPRTTNICSLWWAIIVSTHVFLRVLDLYFSLDFWSFRSCNRQRMSMVSTLTITISSTRINVSPNPKLWQVPVLCLRTRTPSTAQPWLYSWISVLGPSCCRKIFNVFFQLEIVFLYSAFIQIELDSKSSPPPLQREFLSLGDRTRKVPKPQIYLSRTCWIFGDPILYCILNHTRLIWDNLRSSN